MSNERKISFPERGIVFPSRKTSFPARNISLDARVSGLSAAIGAHGIRGIALGVCEGTFLGRKKTTPLKEYTNKV